MISIWRKHQNSSTLIFFGALVAVLLVGCGSTSAAPAPTATSGTTKGTVTLRPQPAGTASFAWDPSNKELTVNVTLTGLAPDSTHPLSLSGGSCAAPGAAVHQLQPIKADKYGDARSVQTVKNVADGIPAKGWYLDVHNGPALTTPDQTQTIACADINNPGAVATAKQVVLTSINGAAAAPGGTAPSGNAELTVANGTLTVKLTIQGLAPNSSHANHIHSGTCGRQGSILYPLTTIKADGAGKATVTTTIHNVSSISNSGWYINVHYGTDVSTQTGYAPLACGNVVTS